MFYAEILICRAAPGATHVRLFAGASQSKISLDLAHALQPFGPYVAYIRIVGTGEDALDFHLALHVGELTAQHPDAMFTIISNENGFDPLIKHLISRGLQCKRVGTVGGSAETKAAKPKPPAKKAAKPAPPPTLSAEERAKESPLLSAVLTRLKGRGA